MVSSEDDTWEASMQDFWFLITAVLFFVIAIGYTYGCDRL